MHAVISWTAPPRKRNVSIINAGIDAFCRSAGYSHKDSLRLQACVEGVFVYCLGNINSIKGIMPINVEMFNGDNVVKVIMKHSGPGGEWDIALKPDAVRSVRRTGFESMGLYIAHEMLEDLTCNSYLDIVSGSTFKEYTLIYKMKWTHGNDEFLLERSS